MTKILWFLVFALIATGLALSAFFYSALPDRIPSHWNASGAIDAYMDKGIVLLLMPLFSLAIAAIFAVLPRIDPLKKNYCYFMSYFRGMILILIAFFFYLHILMIMAGLGFTIKMNYWLMPAISVLFLYLALLLRKSRRNWFVGIRTPWTLSSDAVWEKTNKLASTIFVLFALMLIPAIFLEQALFWLLAFLIVALICLSAYSYFEYAKEQKN